jgi:hypothetical protein|tara:strand:+ start:4281 stop:4751 length:471 start_codon:yes stop_codon:yes gene_type:complete
MAITALIAIGTGSAVASVVQSNKAAKAQQRGVEAQRQQAQSQANRSRRQAIRQNLIQRAQLRNQATAAGVSGGSGFSGGLSSATSQFGANLGFSGVQQGLQNNIFQAQSQAIGYQGRASAFGSLSSLAFQGASMDFSGGGTTTTPTTSTNWWETSR